MNGSNRVDRIECIGIALAGLKLVMAPLLAVSLLYWLLHAWVDAPIEFMELWSSKRSLWDGLAKVWFIFAWCISLAFLLNIVPVLRKTPRRSEPGYIFTKGTWLSVNAGFFEEIFYRWVMLFGAMIALKVFNVITFGFVQWLYETLLTPFANWTSLGLLNEQLSGQHGWLFAAAIVVANMHFAGMHGKGRGRLDGTIAVVNSWYMGLILFYLAFNYGLWVAIVAHILYDCCMLWTRSLLAMFQPRFYQTYNQLRQ